jgi:hypothetical protein
MMSRTMVHNIRLAVATLVGAVLLKAAARGHLLGAESTARSAQMLIGLSLAVFANYIPKTDGASVALRRTGWAFAIAGVAYAIIWAVVPVDVAFPVGLAVIGVVTAGVFTKYLQQRAMWRRR